MRKAAQQSPLDIFCMSRKVTRRKSVCQTRPLNDRELAIVSRYVSGEGKKQIAHALGIAEKTVRTHVANSRRKMGARNDAHLGSLFYRAASVQISCDISPPSINLIGVAGYNCTICNRAIDTAKLPECADASCPIPGTKKGTT